MPAMQITNEVIIASTTVYLAILFYIAYRVDKQAAGGVSKYQPLIYTLSLTVYCTSWTFYGAVGSAAHSGWSFFTIYLGPILVFIFFFPFLRKIIATAKKHKTTSIADFIATRYGKSNRLSVLITLIAFIGTMPYIALQIKAIASSYDTLIGIQSVGDGSPFTGTAFILTVILAIFSILFGARTIDASQHHKGLIYAISFESIVKLIAFGVIAILAFDIVVAAAAQSSKSTTQILFEPFMSFEMTTALLTKTFLAAGAIFLLPRQFHVLAVEARGGENPSRWGLPLYLLLFSLAVIPITAAGLLLVDGKENADLFVLMIPMFEEANALSIFAYLGGFSAATGMVIVATLALSTMVSNEVIFPLLVRFYKADSKQKLHTKLLVVRQMTIFLLMLTAYGYYYLGGAEKSLQSVGLISFAAAIQFLPSIVAAVYWHKGHRNGVVIGLLCGFTVWVYCLLMPSLALSSWMPTWFLNVLADKSSFFNPQQLFFIEFEDSLTHGVFWSLFFNITTFVYISLKSTSRLVDRLQASSYIDLQQTVTRQPLTNQFKVLDLYDLCVRFTGEHRTQEYFTEHGFNIDGLLQQDADSRFIGLSERLLASSIGTATAEHLIKTVTTSTQSSSQSVYEFIDQTGQAIEFNRELLQVTLDHIGQAVSVVDADLRLVAWNRQYLEFFAYPSNFIHVAKPIEDVIRFNVKRGYGSVISGDINNKIQQRLKHLENGDNYTFVREWQNKKIIQTEGARMPDGGYITTYTDITPLKKAEMRLEAINETLEAKVVERTEMLSVVNDQLEKVLNNKTHFLAAASHDLLQPIAASKLYLGALQEDLADDDVQLDLANNALSALKTAESLLKSLLDMSKMDSGLLKPDIREFHLQSLFDSLENEFLVRAERKNLRFKVIANNYNILSDRSLLLSILQNLVANAVRYTSSGSVLVLCRMAGKDHVKVEIRDSGGGIAIDQQKVIFEAFKQLGNASNVGVGLGLAIAQQAANLLNHTITVRSDIAKGSCFSVLIPRVNQKLQAKVPSQYKDIQSIEGLKVVCVDDDEAILKATQSLLQRWGISVVCLKTAQSFISLVDCGERFDVLMMDYQLGEGLNGLELLKYYQSKSANRFYGILTTAEQNQTLKQQTLKAGYKFLPKPAEPAKIRSVFQSFVST